MAFAPGLDEAPSGAEPEPDRDSTPTYVQRISEVDELPEMFERFDDVVSDWLSRLVAKDPAFERAIVSARRISEAFADIRATPFGAQAYMESMQMFVKLVMSEFDDRELKSDVAHSLDSALREAETFANRIPADLRNPLDIPDLVPAVVPAYVRDSLTNAIRGVSDSVQAIVEVTEQRKPIPEVLSQSLIYVTQDFIRAARRSIEAVWAVELNATPEQIDSVLPIGGVSARYAASISRFVGLILVGVQEQSLREQFADLQVSLADLAAFIERAHRTWNESGLSSGPITSHSQTLVDSGQPADDVNYGAAMLPSKPTEAQAPAVEPQVNDTGGRNRRLSSETNSQRDRDAVDADAHVSASETDSSTTELGDRVPRGFLADQVDASTIDESTGVDQPHGADRH
jgi:hypothetical protein